jgi:uncharacterized membrane protein YeaQ/YmgE (transglycosylase-associated protein family)
VDVLLIIGIGIVIGVAVGFAARLLVPGREALSTQGTIVIGIFAAIAGGFVADVIGWGHDDAFDWRTLVVQLAVAVVIVALFHIPTSRRPA